MNGFISCYWLVMTRGVRSSGESVCRYLHLTSIIMTFYHDMHHLKDPKVDGCNVINDFIKCSAQSELPRRGGKAIDYSQTDTFMHGLHRGVPQHD